MTFQKYVQRLRKLSHKRLKTPSEETKKGLVALENLLVSNISTSILQDRSPIVCGCPPERVAVEVRVDGPFQYFTYWYYWSYDLYRTDHVDWEPVTLVFKDNIFERVDFRIHDKLVTCHPFMENGKIVVYFYNVGHTPIIKVRDRKQDISISLETKQDLTRDMWFNYCYSQAETAKWKAIKLPILETNVGPRIDTKNWQTWGKHSIYLKL